MRGATRSGLQRWWTHCYFNPHSPCGERLVRPFWPGGDYEFQSTLPMRGATNHHPHLTIIDGISIHTPHAGSDHQTRYQARLQPHFNPHSPCGERPQKLAAMMEGWTFQSTLPMRGATDIPHVQRFEINISIHTPHAGSDFGDW